MKHITQSILVAGCLFLNGTSFSLQADEHEELRNQKAQLAEMKEHIAELRAKAADMKAIGKHEAAEELVHKAKEGYEIFKKRLAKFERQHAQKNAEMDRSKALKAKLHGMEEKMEHLHREGRHEEAEEIHRHIRKLTSQLKDSSREGGHRGHVVETRRVVVRKDRDGEHEEREHRIHRDHDERRDRREISREDHIRIAIEHLNAAGWHEAAEHLEREFHQRMENERHHGENRVHDHMRELMQGVEHRFNEVREHLEHFERALNENAHRLERLEEKLHDKHSRHD